MILFFIITLQHVLYTVLWDTIPTIYIVRLMIRNILIFSCAWYKQTLVYRSCWQSGQYWDLTQLLEFGTWTAVLNCSIFESFFPVSYCRVPNSKLRYQLRCTLAKHFNTLSFSFQVHVSWTLFPFSGHFINVQ